MRHLAIDGLHHRVRFAADRHRAPEVRIRQRLQRLEQIRFLIQLGEKLLAGNLLHRALIQHRLTIGSEGHRVNWVQLESALLAAISYDSGRQLLDVEFRSGELYRYFHVPAASYDGLLQADSKGSYFNRRIRNHFPYQNLSRRRSPVVLTAKTK
jgi:KTSC domain-containing protein